MQYIATYSLPPVYNNRNELMIFPSIVFYCGNNYEAQVIHIYTGPGFDSQWLLWVFSLSAGLY